MTSKEAITTKVSRKLLSLGVQNVDKQRRNYNEAESKVDFLRSPKCWQAKKQLQRGWVESCFPSESEMLTSKDVITTRLSRKLLSLGVQNVDKQRSNYNGAESKVAFPRSLKCWQAKKQLQRGWVESCFPSESEMLTSKEEITTRLSRKLLSLRVQNVDKQRNNYNEAKLKVALPWSPKCWQAKKQFIRGLVKSFTIFCNARHNSPFYDAFAGVVKVACRTAMWIVWYPPNASYPILLPCPGSHGFYVYMSLRFLQPERNYVNHLLFLYSKELHVHLSHDKYFFCSFELVWQKF